MGIVLLGIVTALGATLALVGTGVVGASTQPLVFTSASVEAEYSGAAISSDEFTITSGKLKEGHTAYADMSGSQTEAGTSDNTFTVTVLDERGNDVTSEYEYECVPGKLTVIPRKLELKSGDGSKVYDGTELKIESATVVDGTLADGNELVYTFAGGITKWGTADNVFSARVIDAKKRDVTSNYAITYGYGALTVTKRKISVTTESAQKTYDGTPLTADGCEVSEGTLADGHKLEINTTGTITAVGTSANTFEINIFDADGNSVAENYEVTPVRGTLTVTKRKISVATDSAQKHYDGEPLTEEGFSMPEGALASGHDLDVFANGSITNVGTADNTFDAVVTDADGADVTENYEITPIRGILTVTKRALTVTTVSDKKTYDGTPLSNDDCILSSALIEGHRAVVVESASITDAGKIPNTVRLYITDGYVDVSGNYEIVQETGTLEVAPAVITVETGSVTREYNGEALTDKRWRVTTSGINGGNDFVTGGSVRLYANDYLSLDVYGSQTVAGSSDNSYAVAAILRGAEDVSANYTLRPKYGKLTVTKRTLVIAGASASKQYDGTPLAANDLETKYVLTGETVTSDTLNVTVNASITNAGSTQNIPAYTLTNAGNYEVSVIAGTLTVTKRIVTVAAASATKVYDGAPLSTTKFTVASGTLLGGHGITATERVSITDVGTAANVLNISVMNGGVDVSENYDIRQTAGTLEVLPCELVIETRPASRVYDGTPLTAPFWRLAATANYTASGDSIDVVGGGSLTVEVFGTQTIAGSSDNNCIVRAITKNGRDASENYTVRLHLGALTVTRRPLAVKSGSKSQPYKAGEILTCNEWDIVSETTLADGDDIRVTVTGARADVGESPNTIAEVMITDRTGTDVTANYDILRDPGYLLVTGRSTTLDDPGEPPDIVTLKLYSDVTNKSIYLRSGSYGEYNGYDFDDAVEYTGASAMSYLPTNALARGVGTPIDISVDLILANFMLPYYAVYDDALPQPSDVYFDSALTYYTAAYYSYDYLSDNGAYIKNLAISSAEETAYRAFVKDNYLSVPASTREYLERFIAEKGINASSATLIGDIASVVKNSAEYSYYYPAELNQAEDRAVAFLRDYKKGVCVHYATAATLIYRVLGIPARYTTGYMGNTEAGQWVEIKAKNAHAWVEVYVDGVGWIPVEVTGSSPDSDPIEDPNGSAVKPSVDDNTVKPVDCYKKYDGTPLTPRNELQGLSKYTSAGYTYEVTVTGSQTEIGYGTSVIERFVLRDSNGTVVLDKNGDKIICYDPAMSDIAFGDGRLHVYEYEITVSSGSASKIFDGTPLVCEEFTVTDGADGLNERGHTLTVSGFTRHDGVGSVSNRMNVKVLDGNDDVSVYYHVTYQTGNLTIEPVEITVRAGSRTVTSAELAEMGGTLTCDEYTLIYKDEETTFDRIADLCGLENYTIEVTLSGSLSRPGSADNIVESVIIRNAVGNNVTSLFRISDEVGKLAVRR